MGSKWKLWFVLALVSMGVRFSATPAGDWETGLVLQEAYAEYLPAFSRSQCFSGAITIGLSNVISLSVHVCKRSL